jgi:prophage DNA circulation protein
MSWLDGYLVASFRGITFLVERTSQQGGRRIVEDDLPERDDSYFQDMGRKNRSFSIKGYLIGDEYYSQRDKLIKALEEPGTGTLVHPYRGDYEVRCTDYAVDEQSSEGRMCRFDLTFQWESDESLVVLAPDWGLDALDKKLSFLQALDAAFAAAYELASAPANLIQDVTRAVNKALDYVEKAKQVVGAYDDFQRNLASLRGKVLQFALQAEFISKKLGDIIDFGTDPSAAIDDVVASSELVATSAATTTAEILTAGEIGKRQYQELGALVGFDEEDLTSFPSISDDDPNHPTTLIQQLVARKALASRVGLAISMDLDSVQAADDVLADTNTQIAKIEADEYADTEVIGAARDLRAAVESIIENRSISTNRLNALDLPEWEPAIVTAYSLYEDPTRSEEIARLNSVVHPGFLPGERLAVYAR